MQKITTVTGYIEGLAHWKEEIILLRELVLASGLDETIKWGGPCYTKGGQNILGLAAFKTMWNMVFPGWLLKDYKTCLSTPRKAKPRPCVNGVLLL